MIDKQEFQRFVYNPSAHDGLDNGFFPLSYYWNADSMTFPDLPELYRFMAHLQTTNANEVSGSVQESSSGQPWFHFQVSDSQFSAVLFENRQDLNAWSWHSHPNPELLPPKLNELRGFHDDATLSDESRRMGYEYNDLISRIEEVSPSKPSWKDMVAFAAFPRHKDCISFPNNQLAIMSVRIATPESPIHSLGIQARDILDKLEGERAELGATGIRMSTLEYNVRLSYQWAKAYEKTLNEVGIARMEVANWPRVLDKLGVPLELLSL